jgi:hypothetical protein
MPHRAVCVFACVQLLVIQGLGGIWFRGFKVTLGTRERWNVGYSGCAALFLGWSDALDHYSIQPQ